MITISKNVTINYDLELSVKCGGVEWRSSQDVVSNVRRQVPELEDLIIDISDDKHITIYATLPQQREITFNIPEEVDKEIKDCFQSRRDNIIESFYEEIGNIEIVVDKDIDNEIKEKFINSLKTNLHLKRGFKNMDIEPNYEDLEDLLFEEYNKNIPLNNKKDTSQIEIIYNSILQTLDMTEYGENLYYENERVDISLTNDSEGLILSKTSNNMIKSIQYPFLNSSWENFLEALKELLNIIEFDINKLSYDTEVYSAG